MAKKKVTFVWNWVSYTMPEDTDKHKILLPNGIVLEFNGFLETSPPQLANLKALGFTVMILPETHLQEVADRLDAVLASELGYCPDHPEEHGNFCSVCGKKIYAPVTLPPKPPFPFTTNNSPVDVMGNGPCPNCKKPLDHGAHASTCPNCGQALHWTCR